VSRQPIGSLLVAVAIVAITILVVSARVGPNAEERGDDGGSRTEQQDDSSGRGRGRGGDED
jgi:hypothetical protein